MTSFLSSEAHGFLLYGDINGYAYEGVSNRVYLLSALGSRREVVKVTAQAAFRCIAHAERRHIAEK